MPEKTISPIRRLSQITGRRFHRSMRRIHRLSYIIDRRFYRQMKSADSCPAVDSYPAGSKKWLMATEKQYGGLTNIPEVILSPDDPRYADVDFASIVGGVTRGGDRMMSHYYSPYYAKHLKRFVKNRFAELAIAEVGILSGIGLATWSDLFPKSNIFALDIDFSSFRANEDHLRFLGAFPSNSPTLIEYDQFAEPTADVIAALGDTRFSIVIDDASHFPEGILNTIDFMQGHLAEDFVYFIEDCDAVENDVREKFPDAQVARYGELTVIDGSPKK